MDNEVTTNPARKPPRMVAFLTETCAACPKTSEQAWMYRVPAGNITFNAGDHLCGVCAKRHGVL